MSLESDRPFNGRLFFPRSFFIFGYVSKIGQLEWARGGAGLGVDCLVDPDSTREPAYASAYGAGICQRLLMHLV